jgi:hypothetical protein
VILIAQFLTGGSASLQVLRSSPETPFQAPFRSKQTTALFPLALGSVNTGAGEACLASKTPIQQSCPELRVSLFVVGESHIAQTTIMHGVSAHSDDKNDEDVSIGLTTSFNVA